MMMMIETKRSRKRLNISKQAYEPLSSTTTAAMAEEEEEKSALARFSCFPRANAAGKARLNADCWCRKTILIHRVLLFKKSQKRTSEQKKGKKKSQSSSNQKYTNTKHNNNIKPPKKKKKNLCQNQKGVLSLRVYCLLPQTAAAEEKSVRSRNGDKKHTSKC